MRVAGFWRRFVCVSINFILSILTLGIYFIFMVINYFRGKQDLGMKAAKVNWSDDRQLRFLIFWLLLSIIYVVPLAGLVELIMICLKKGTFAEQISGTYLVIDNFEKQQLAQYDNFFK